MLHFWLVYPNDTLFIQDGNAIFLVLKNFTPTFGAICLQMLDQMVAKNLLFSTDSYNTDSLKAVSKMCLSILFPPENDMGNLHGNL